MYIKRSETTSANTSNYWILMSIMNMYSLVCMGLFFFYRKNVFLAKRSPHLVLTAAFATLIDFNITILSFYSPEFVTPQIPCLILHIIRTLIGFVPIFALFMRMLYLFITYNINQVINQFSSDAGEVISSTTAITNTTHAATSLSGPLDLDEEPRIKSSKSSSLDKASRLSHLDLAAASHNMDAMTKFWMKFYTLFVTGGKKMSVQTAQNLSKDIFVGRLFMKGLVVFEVLVTGLLLAGIFTSKNNFRETPLKMKCDYDDVITYTDIIFYLIQIWVIKMALLIRKIKDAYFLKLELEILFVLGIIFSILALSLSSSNVPGYSFDKMVTGSSMLYITIMITIPLIYNFYRERKFYGILDRFSRQAFEVVLRDIGLRLRFKDFVVGDLMVEYFLFFERQQRVPITSKKSKTLMNTTITSLKSNSEDDLIFLYDVFVEENAPNELIVDESIKQRLKQIKKIRPLELADFEILAGEVLEKLYKNSFPRFIIESQIDESILMTKERRTSISVLLNSIVDTDRSNVVSNQSSKNLSSNSLPSIHSNNNSYTIMPGVGASGSNNNTTPRIAAVQLRTGYSNNNSSPNKNRTNNTKNPDQKTMYSIVRLPLVPINEEESYSQ